MTTMLKKRWPFGPVLSEHQHPFAPPEEDRAESPDAIAAKYAALVCRDETKALEG